MSRCSMFLFFIEMAMMAASLYEIWAGDFETGLLLMILSVVIGIDRKADEKDRLNKEAV